MGTVIDEKEFRKAKRRAQAREFIRDKTEKLSDWVEEHQDFLKIAVPIGAGVTTAIAKGARTAAQRRKLKKVQDLKENYCYDRSLGHYWELRRKLTNDEWVVIDQRKKNGERLADILSDLKVLK